MESPRFGEYDQDKLQKAKDLLLEVYTYHYGDPKMKPLENRLETIITKLEILQNL